MAAIGHRLPHLRHPVTIAVQLVQRAAELRRDGDQEGFILLAERFALLPLHDEHPDQLAQMQQWYAEKAVV